MHKANLEKLSSQTTIINKCRKSLEKGTPGLVLEDHLTMFTLIIKINEPFLGTLS
jgi:hypothetical protein